MLLHPFTLAPPPHPPALLCRLLHWVWGAIRSAGRSCRPERSGLRLPGQNRETRVPERFVETSCHVAFQLTPRNMEKMWLIDTHTHTNNLRNSLQVLTNHVILQFFLFLHSSAFACLYKVANNGFVFILPLSCMCDVAFASVSNDFYL